VGGCGLFIDGSGTASATLTLAAPNVLLFGTPCGIYVDYMNVGQGFLVAQGTSLTTNEILFSSLNTVSPAAGDWDGIQFGHSEDGQGASSLAYCMISYAAGPTTDITPTGAVVTDMYLGSSTGPSIANCEFDHYALATTPMGGCCGIVAMIRRMPATTVQLAGEPTATRSMRTERRWEMSASRWNEYSAAASRRLHGRPLIRSLREM
jgi:hypothetical protein